MGHFMPHNNIQLKHAYWKLNGIYMNRKWCNPNFKSTFFSLLSLSPFRVNSILRGDEHSVASAYLRSFHYEIQTSLCTTSYPFYIKMDHFWASLFCSHRQTFNAAHFAVAAEFSIYYTPACILNNTHMQIFRQVSGCCEQSTIKFYIWIEYAIKKGFSETIQCGKRIAAFIRVTTNLVPLS